MKCKGFPLWLSSKVSTCNGGYSGDGGSIPGSGGSPGEGPPTSVFLPGESHGQRGQAGYSPWCCKESDTTEHTTTRSAKSKVDNGERRVES